MGNLRRDGRNSLDRRPSEVGVTGSLQTSTSTLETVGKEVSEGAVRFTDEYVGRSLENEVTADIKKAEKEFVGAFEQGDLVADLELEMEGMSPEERKQVQPKLDEMKQAVKQGIIPERDMLLKAQEIMKKAIGRSNKRYHQRIKESVTGILGRDPSTALIDMLVAQGREEQRLLDNPEEPNDFQQELIDSRIKNALNDKDNRYGDIFQQGLSRMDLYKAILERDVALNNKNLQEEHFVANEKKVKKMKELNLADFKATSSKDVNQFVDASSAIINGLYKNYAILLRQATTDEERNALAIELEAKVKNIVQQDKSLVQRYIQNLSGVTTIVENTEASDHLRTLEKDKLAFLDAQLEKFDKSDEAVEKLAKWNEITKQLKTKERNALDNWFFDPENQVLGAAILNSWSSLAIGQSQELSEELSRQVGQALSSILLDDQADTAYGLVSHLQQLTGDLKDSMGKVPPEELMDTYWDSYPDLMDKFKKGKLNEREIKSFALMTGRMANSLVAGEHEQWDKMYNVFTSSDFQEMLEQAPPKAQEFAKRAIAASGMNYFVGDMAGGQNDRVVRELRFFNTDRVKISVEGGKARVNFDPNNVQHYKKEDQKYFEDILDDPVAQDTYAKQVQRVENIINDTADILWQFKDYDPMLSGIKSKEELIDFMLHGDAGALEDTGQQAIGGGLRKAGLTVQKDAKTITRGLSPSEINVKARVEFEQKALQSKLAFDEAEKKAEERRNELELELSGYKKRAEEAEAKVKAIESGQASTDQLVKLRKEFPELSDEQLLEMIRQASQTGGVPA